jgi:hypothetical protein
LDIDAAAATRLADGDEIRRDRTHAGRARRHVAATLSEGIALTRVDRDQLTEPEFAAGATLRRKLTLPRAGASAPFSTGIDRAGRATRAAGCAADAAHATRAAGPGYTTACASGTLSASTARARGVAASGCARAGGRAADARRTAAVGTGIRIAIAASNCDGDSESTPKRHSSHEWPI